MVRYESLEYLGAHFKLKKNERQENVVKEKGSLGDLVKIGRRRIASV
jgi:hypothetical protein